MTVKRLMCVLFVVFLLVVPVSADYDSYYEVEPVVSGDIGNMSLLGMAASSRAVSDSGVSTMSLTTNESTWLHDIRNALISYSGGASDNSVLGYLQDIEYFDSLIYSEIQNLDNVTLPYANNKLDQIVSALTNTTDGVKPVISIMASRLNSILSDTSSVDAVVNQAFNFGTSSYPWSIGGQYQTNRLSWSNIGADLYTQLVTYGYHPWNTDEYTLFHHVRNLGKVLASEDDVALAGSQKDNREEIEDSFLSGSSGGTSLGKSDFGALSDIGDTVKETISLNGQSSVSDFTDGLAGADEAGQGWFSESTRSALDTVSSSASYGLRDDPYNMSGWQDRYAWLEGEQ